MPEPLSEQDAHRFQAAIDLFDQANARDPNLEAVGDLTHPREWIYARWLSAWVDRLCPTASEELRLAARCQHLCRWMIPRTTFPMTRTGYLKWREDLKHFQAEQAGLILQALGYPEASIARVRALILKQNFPAAPESRVLEDALCLVFLEHQFAALASKTPEAKMIGILQKSWKKMTPAAHAAALSLAFSRSEKALLELALQPAADQPVADRPAFPSS